MRGMLIAAGLVSALALTATPAAAISLGGDSTGDSPRLGAGEGVYGGPVGSAGYPPVPQQQYSPGATDGPATAAAPQIWSVAGLFDRIGSGFSQLYRTFTLQSEEAGEPASYDTSYYPPAGQRAAPGGYGDPGTPALAAPAPGSFGNGPGIGGVLDGGDAIAQARAALVGTALVSSDGAVLGTVTDVGVAEGGHSYLGVDLDDGLQIGLDKIQISTENAAFNGQGVQVGETLAEFVDSMRAQLAEAGGVAR